MFILGKTLELSELNNLNTDREFKRNTVDILCIDDQGFQYEEILRHHGFSIRVIKDIEDIKAVEAYPIVICDIKGIGKSFNSPYEGGHIIQEIKKCYPSKTVVAFSGHSFDTKYNKFFKMADHVVSKDIDSDDWVNLLDEIVKQMISPIEQWKSMRQYLINQDVSTKTVFKLEQEYIEAMMKKDINKFGKEKTLGYLGSDIRGVIQGFTASLIFKWVIGS